MNDRIATGHSTVFSLRDSNVAHSGGYSPCSLLLIFPPFINADMHIVDQKVMDQAVIP